MPSRILALLVAALTVAGCGLDDVSPGVRVVAAPSASDVPPDVAAGDAAGTGRPPARPAGEGAPPGGGDAGSTEHTAGEAPVGLPATIAVVGDSLTLSAEREIGEVFAGLGIDVIAVDGVESRRMTRGGSGLPPGIEAIDAIVEGGDLPELWIIALGTNDVGAQVSAEAFADDVATVLGRIPAGAPVVWVDIWIRDRVDDTVVANGALRSVLSLRPDTHVADWHAWGAVPGTITGDGIHLTDAGKRRFATAMAAAVRRRGAG